MHVPPIRPAPGRSDGLPPSDGAAALKGIARHVSNEGCQFVLTGMAPQIGQRLTFALASEPAISGVIRWVLDDRIGFAFARPISGQAMAELTGHFATLKAIELAESR